MKNIHFFLEYPNQELRNAARPRSGNWGEHGGTVAAIFLDTGHMLHAGGYGWDALVSATSAPNGEVCYSGVGFNYLSTHCRRISEGKAREVHPALFERMEADAERERIFQAAEEERTGANRAIVLDVLKKEEKRAYIDFERVRYDWTAKPQILETILYNLGNPPLPFTVQGLLFTLKGGGYGEVWATGDTPYINRAIYTRIY